MEQRILLFNYPFKLLLKKVVLPKYCAHCGKIIEGPGKTIDVDLGTGIFEKVDVHLNAPDCADISFLDNENNLWVKA